MIIRSYEKGSSDEKAEADFYCSRGNLRGGTKRRVRRDEDGGSPSPRLRLRGIEVVFSPSASATWSSQSETRSCRATDRSSSSWLPPIKKISLTGKETELPESVTGENSYDSGHGTHITGQFRRVGDFRVLLWQTLCIFHISGVVAIC